MIVNPISGKYSSFCTMCSVCARTDFKPTHVGTSARRSNVTRLNQPWSRARSSHPRAPYTWDLLSLFWGGILNAQSWAFDKNHCNVWKCPLHRKYIPCCTFVLQKVSQKCTSEVWFTNSFCKFESLLFFHLWSYYAFVWQMKQLVFWLLPVTRIMDIG